MPELVSQTPVLTVEHVTVTFAGRDRRTVLCDDVGFSLAPGELVGLVGESGSGKSMTSMAILGLLPAGASITSGSVRLIDEELTSATPKRLQQIRGARIAYIAQDATASLNPVLKIGTQIVEVLTTHLDESRAEARRHAIELLDRVGIPDPERRMDAFPHELSGGMRQRVVIAIALACRPSVIIADEPTTALDVTVQAQVIRLIADLAAENDTAVLMISHDLGVIASVTDRTLVMYSGRIVEELPSSRLGEDARHPYTRALLHATPSLHGESRKRFETVPGQPPDPTTRPSGCAFHPRCPRRVEICSDRVPELGSDAVACWNPHTRLELGGAA